MKEWRQVLLGILVALLSGAILLGSFLVSLVEGGAGVSLAPTLTFSSQFETMPTLIFITPGGPTLKPTNTGTPTPTITPRPGCSFHEGWISIEVQPGDTLSGLARMYGITPAELAAGNCEDPPVESLAPGSILMVPPVPATATPTLTRRPTLTRTPAPACRAPYGWVAYIVRAGDNLYSLAASYGVMVSDLQWANCMGTSTKIITGQVLLVPPVPPRPPSPTSTRVPSRTPTPTVPIPLTHTPTSTQTGGYPISSPTPTSLQMERPAFRGAPSARSSIFRYMRWASFAV